MNTIEKLIQNIPRYVTGDGELVRASDYDAVCHALRLAVEQRDELHAKCCALRAGHAVLLVRKLSSYDAIFLAVAQEVIK